MRIKGIPKGFLSKTSPSFSKNFKIPHFSLHCLDGITLELSEIPMCLGVILAFLETEWGKPNAKVFMCLLDMQEDFWKKIGLKNIDKEIM